MKPIAVKVDKDDKVIMTFSEFKKALDEAYRQGREDGSYRYWTPTPYYGASISCGTLDNCLTTNTSGNADSGIVVTGVKV